ncbi:unnamed protein product [Discosporangium mesarthrocarpum]
MPPGNAVLRLAELLGLSLAEGGHHVRALLARKALGNGDTLVACELISMALVRCHEAATAGAAQGSALPQEVFEVVEAILSRGKGGGNECASGALVPG